MDIRTKKYIRNRICIHNFYQLVPISVMILILECKDSLKLAIAFLSDTQPCYINNSVRENLLSLAIKLNKSYYDFC